MTIYAAQTTVLALIDGYVEVVIVEASRKEAGRPFSVTAVTEDEFGELEQVLLDRKNVSEGLEQALEIGVSIVEERWPYAAASDEVNHVLHRGN
jgi:hypothetical protein